MLIDDMIQHIDKILGFGNTFFKNCQFFFHYNIQRNSPPKISLQYNY